MSTETSIDPHRARTILSFLEAAEGLKSTLRSGCTASGRRESVAEHSWRLCLLVCLCERDLPGLDLALLLKLCLVHDLGEVISGDVPAPLQAADDDRQARERADMGSLCEVLPPDLRAEMLTLWKDYAAGKTPEAALAKGFDKIETMQQHLVGANGPDFDYAFNLTYGRSWTEAHPLLSALRPEVDRATQKRHRSMTADRRASNRAERLGSCIEHRAGNGRPHEK